MKKLFSLAAALLLGCTAALAEGLTATLQQGETMTAYYGVNAFQQAYTAAGDGDVITLSAGQFNDVTTIEKSITVRGAMAFEVEGTERTFLGTTTVNANNVTLEGIYFSSDVYLAAITDCHIKRCRIGEVLRCKSTSDYHTNTVVDQCVIAYVNAIATGKNFCIKNSTIGCFSASNAATNVAYITNCYIKYFYVSRGSGYYRPYAIYKNCVLGIDNYGYTADYGFYLYSPSEFYNNVFYRTTTSSSTSYTQYSVSYSFDSGCLNSGNSYYNNGSSSYPSTYQPYAYPTNYLSESLGKTGDDGTPAGITGGAGFSPYPAVPRIVSSEIASRTDSQGKLNVKITVKTQE